MDPTRKVYIEFCTGHVTDPVEMVAIIARQEHAYADERFGEAVSSLSKKQSKRVLEGIVCFRDET